MLTMIMAMYGEITVGAAIATMLFGAIPMYVLSVWKS